MAIHLAVPVVLAVVSAISGGVALVQTRRLKQTEEALYHVGCHQAAAEEFAMTYKAQSLHLQEELSHAYDRIESASSTLQDANAAALEQSDLLNELRLREAELEDLKADPYRHLISSLEEHEMRAGTEISELASIKTLRRESKRLYTLSIAVDDFYQSRMIRAEAEQVDARANHLQDVFESKWRNRLDAEEALDDAAE